MAAGLASVAMLAASAAPAAAAPGPAVAAGTISTVAGGVGGPDPGLNVSLSSPCGVSYGNGSVYVAERGAAGQLSPSTGRVTPVAGTGSTGPLGDGGPALSADLGTCPNTLDQTMTAVDPNGNLLIPDVLTTTGFSPSEIRVVAKKTGTFYGQPMTAGDIYNVAGGGSDRSHIGNGGPAVGATLEGAQDVSIDSAGNLLIADTNDDEVRVVAVKTGTFYGQAMTAGDIYVVAGNQKGGYSGNGGPARKAELGGPQSVTADAAGNLVVTDSGNNMVRVVAKKTGTFYGQAMKANDIYTIAGTGQQGYSGDGGPAISAELSDPGEVTVDPSGNLVIADSGNIRVRVVAATSGTFYGQAMKAGDIYTIAGNGTGTYSGDGGPATSAGIEGVGGVTLDGSGNLVLGDGSGRIRVVAKKTGTFYGQAMKASDIYTVAGNGVPGYSGDGTPATSAVLSPDALATTPAGNLAVTAGDLVRMVAETAGPAYGKTMKAGYIYHIAGDGTAGYSGDGGPAPLAELYGPSDVASDATGNLVIADTGNQRIRVVAAKAGTFYGQAMKAGDIYTIAGDGSAGYSGDGGPATSAELDFPSGVAVDAAGNVLIADPGNNRVRVLAAKTGTYYGVAMTAGDIYTVAGDGHGGYAGNKGLATSAELNQPGGVTVDSHGNLVISDTYNWVVRVVAAKAGTFYGQAMKAGHIYTVAGNGQEGLAGDGGPALSAEFNGVNYLTVDGAGNLVLSDTPNGQVRVVAESSGTFYGVPMTAGDIYVVAGDGTYGFSGDGGPATSAEITHPEGVAISSAGDLLFADSGNARVREVTG